MSGKFRFGVLTFSDDANWVTQPISDFEAVKTKLTAIEGQSRETNLQTVLPKISSMVGKQGTGSIDNPRKIIVLITDGLQTSQSSFISSVIKKSDCDQLTKIDGVELYLLETSA